MDMAKAKCFRCGASAPGKTFEDARKKLDHAIGLSRGIKCGDTYGRVFEVKDKLKPKPKPIKPEPPKEKPPIEFSEPQPEQKKEKKKPKVIKEKYL